MGLAGLGGEGSECKVALARRHHDATPMLLSFGRLEEALQPHARYLVRDVDSRGHTCWKPVSLTEYRKRYPRGSVASGVLEVFGQKMDIFTISRRIAFLKPLMF